MFTSLLGWFSGVWAQFKEWLQTFNGWVVSVWTWVATIIVGFLTITDALVEFVWGMVVTLFSFIANITNEANLTETLPGDLGIGPVFATVNTFVPLAEFFVLLGSWSLIMVAMLVYRFVKSWIPTVN